MREQGRQNFLKGDARQDAIIPGQRREGREGEPQPGTEV